MKRSFFIASIALLFLSPLKMVAADPYEAYIEQYYSIAVEHMEQYDIPASITLAQGLLESAAGRSRLAIEGNNHFGIKCHKEWKGASMLRDDDAHDECFRVYNTPEESFEDHSKFLRRTRYQKLFSLDITDYKGWARGLRECGYATDPNYAARLITIIERYGLYSYDTGESHDPEEISAFIHQMLVTSHPLRKSRGLHYVVSTPGDTYGSIAKEFNIPVKKLMEYNDVNRDGEIKDWEEVYLTEKLDTAPDGVSVVTIGEDESFHSIAQRFGMRLEAIKALNKKVKDKPGNQLRLR